MSPEVKTEIQLLEEAAGRITQYAASSNRIICAIHGWRDHIYTRNSRGIKIRICVKCFYDIIPELNDVVTTTGFKPKACNEPGCMNIVLEKNTCCWCKEDYCAAHMPDGDACNACEKDWQENETLFQRI